MDLENLTIQEQEFRDSLEASGVPTTDDAFRAEWQSLADDAGIPIANASPFSAFWVLLTSIATRPALWLIAFMIRVVMPNLYVKTATGISLDLLAEAYNIKRKPGQKARGKITFSRTNAAQPVDIPAGTRIRTVPLNGVIYRMVTLEDTVIETGFLEGDIPCEAEAEGVAYNLTGGAYSLLDSDVPGITRVENRPGWQTLQGTDEEPDIQLRLRIRDQFSAAGDWHTDAKYRSLIAARIGFQTDRIFFVRYNGPPAENTEEHNDITWGPGSAYAYVLFDSDPPAGLIDDVNDYIRNQGNHGHGDNLQVKVLPDKFYVINANVTLRSNLTADERSNLRSKIDAVIRCAFRQNTDYADQVTQTWPYSQFNFSRLDYELHTFFPAIVSLTWQYRAATATEVSSKIYDTEAEGWQVGDISSEREVPRLFHLNIEETA